LSGNNSLRSELLILILVGSISSAVSYSSLSCLANTAGSIALTSIWAKSASEKYLMKSGFIWILIVKTGIANRPLKSNYVKNWYWLFGKKLTLTPGTTDELTTLTHKILWQSMQSFAVNSGGKYESLTPWTIFPKRCTVPVNEMNDLEGVYGTQVLAFILDPPWQCHPF
jgi:hypothetical protein